MTKQSVTKVSQGIPRIYRVESGHLMARVSYRGARYALATGCPPIPLSQWIESEQRVKRAGKIAHKNRAFTGAEINTTLDRFNEVVSNHLNTYGSIRKDILSVELNQAPAASNFYEQVFELIDGLEEVTAQTKGAKKTIWEKIQRIEPALRWETINMAFYDRLLRELKKQNYYQPGKFIKEVKAMCTLGVDRDYPVCPDYKKKSFKVVWRETQIEYQDYLTQDELDTLFEINDPIINGLLVGCYTGLRHSDWKQAIPANVKNGLLHIHQQKVDKPLVLPVHPRLKELWKRGVRVISNQKTNDHIHVALPLYEITKKITTHSGRRTFATLNYQAGTPISILYQYTGHSSEKQLKAYLKIQSDDAAKMAKDLKFFQS